MLQARQKIWTVGAILALFLLAIALGQTAQAAPAPDSQRDKSKDKDAKEKPSADAKKDDGKKDDGKKDPRQSPKGPVPFPFDFDSFLKNLPPGAIDPDQLERMKKEMMKTRELYEKMMAEFSKKNPAGFPGVGFPGVGFPGVGFPKGFPGIPPVATPPGGLPSFPGGFGPTTMMQQLAIEGRLGAGIEKPSSALIDQLDLPKKQGLVIREVKATSSAAKAGLKVNDILLEINGKAVPDDLTILVKQLAEIKADAAVDAVVLRKGKKETIKGITLPEFKFPGFGPPPGAPGAPGAPGIPGAPGAVPLRAPQLPRIFDPSLPRLAALASRA